MQQIAREVGRRKNDLGMERIRATVDAIPRGCVATYGQVAEEAGLPGRARLVGKTLRELEPSSGLPWHRVVGAGGRLAMGSEEGSGKTQFRRLGKEGIQFNSSRRIDLKRFGWRP